jgi:hypothetical protein
LRTRFHASDRPQGRAPIYEHLIVNGKLHKVAMVATMRRLLLMLNAIIKTKTSWSSPCPA